MERTFEIEVNGETRKIFMSYGLLDVLCRIAGDMENTLLFNVDHELRTEVLNALLAKRDAEGKIVEELNLFQLEADPDDISDLLDWAGGHALGFFVRALEKSKARGEEIRPKMEALQPSSSGGAT